MKKGKYLIVVVALLLVSLILSCAPAPAPAPPPPVPPVAPVPPAPAPAPEWPPPKPELIRDACYDIGSSHFLWLSTMAKGFDEKFGVTMRVIPIGTDVARVMAVKTGSADFWGGGVGPWAVAEGFGEYAAINWGPQPVRYLYICHRATILGPVTRADSGIKTMADVKGKRVVWQVGNPGILAMYTAWLAFAGLTWDDVEVVEFPSYGSAGRGLIEGKVDLGFFESTAPLAGELETSPHGIYWVPLPRSDVEGWKRLQKVFPLATPIAGTVGFGTSPEHPVESSTHHTAMATFPELDEGLAYWVTKLFAEGHEGAIHASWWDIDECLSASRAAPFHKGAVRYFKEIGKWTAEQEEIDQYWLNRQKVFVQAFEATKTESIEKGIKAKEFPDFWLRKVEALKEAGRL